MTDTIKIMIADDHRIVLDGLVALINTTKDIEVVGLAINGKQTLEILEKHSDINIAVLDLEMKVMDGLETTRKIKEKYPKVKVLILTMHEGESFIKAILGVGAEGYILKNKGSNELLSAIRTIYQGEKYFGKKVMDILLNSYQNREAIPVTTPLTEREKEVLQLIGQGLRAKQIGAKLGIKSSTVVTHSKNLLDKLGVEGKAGLIKYAIEHGYVGSSSE